MILVLDHLHRLVDELSIYIGPCIIGGKNTPTMADGAGIKNESELIPLTFDNVKRLGEGVLITYKA